MASLGANELIQRSTSSQQGPDRRHLQFSFHYSLMILIQNSNAMEVYFCYYIIGHQIITFFGKKGGSLCYNL